MDRRHLPNLLTVARAVLAFVFFLVLSNYRYGTGPDWALAAALVIFVIAAVSDWADGFLARRWNVISTFGRIMDPFCDKVLVLGALIYLAGPRFVDVDVAQAREALRFGVIPGNMVSGIYPWMVAVILARELLVTAIRGELEGRGIQFGAKLSGKLKAILQMVVIPAVLAIIWLLDHDLAPRTALLRLRDGLVYLTVIVTALSGLPYITGAWQATRGRDAEALKPDPATEDRSARTASRPRS